MLIRSIMFYEFDQKKKNDSRQYRKYPNFRLKLDRTAI